MTLDNAIITHWKHGCILRIDERKNQEETICLSFLGSVMKQRGKYSALCTGLFIIFKADMWMSTIQMLGTDVEEGVHTNAILQSLRTLMVWEGS